jgi:hypothetical protein
MLISHHIVKSVDTLENYDLVLLKLKRHLPLGIALLKPEAEMRNYDLLALIKGIKMVVEEIEIKTKGRFSVNLAILRPRRSLRIDRKIVFIQRNGMCFYPNPLKGIANLLCGRSLPGTRRPGQKNNMGIHSNRLLSNTSSNLSNLTIKNSLTLISKPPRVRNSALVYVINTIRIWHTSFLLFK